jgi:hypothetical protein
MARPGQWKEATKMIRVPVSQAETLLEIAHRVDQGIPDDFESKPNDEKYSDSELDAAIVDVLIRTKISDRIVLGKGFDRLRARLKNPPQ